MLNVIIPILGVVFTTWLAPPQQEAPAEDCYLVGAWEVESLRFTDPDGTVRDVEIGDPPGLKIFSETHWVFVEQNGPDDAAPTSGGGGRYTVEGNTYTEFVQYHAARDFVGQTLPFECRVEDDRWYQTGMLPDGVKLEEVYRRPE